jgi:hypothetical protein
VANIKKSRQHTKDHQQGCDPSPSPGKLGRGLSEAEPGRSLGARRIKRYKTIAKKIPKSLMTVLPGMSGGAQVASERLLQLSKEGTAEVLGRNS